MAASALGLELLLKCAPDDDGDGTFAAEKTAEGVDGFFWDCAGETAVEGLGDGLDGDSAGGGGSGGVAGV